MLIQINIFIQDMVFDRFDSTSLFPLPNLNWGKNLVIFGVDNGSSVPIGNKKQERLVLGKGPTQGVDDTRIAAEIEYSIDFLKSARQFCSIVHYNGNNSVFFASALKINKFRAKISEIKNSDFAANNMKNQN